MRKLSTAFIAFLFVAAIYSTATADSTVPSGPSARAGVSSDYNPIVTHMEVREYKGWKNSERYDFSYIDGFQEIYNPGEQIIFSVEGKSDKLYVEKSSGFDVTATIFDLSRNIGKRAEVKYDPSRRTWKVKLIAPKESGKEYKIVLNLFCKKNDSQCATTYGFGTQIDKSLPLQVR